MRGEGLITDNELHSSLTDELDKIGNLETNIGSVSALNTTSKEVVGAINEVHAQKPDDYGRFVGEFGWNGTELDNCYVNDNLKLGTFNTIKQQEKNTDVSIYGDTGVGQKILSSLTQNIDEIIYVDIFVNQMSENAPNIRVSLYDNTTKTQLAISTIPSDKLKLSMNRVYFDSIKFTKGNELVIRIDTNGLGDDSNKIYIGSMGADVQNEANQIYTSNLWTTISEHSTFDLTYNIGYVKSETSGTATKTITPNNIEKWGNLKVTASDLNENNSASVDIISKSSLTNRNEEIFNNVFSIFESHYGGMRFIAPFDSIKMSATLKLFQQGNTHGDLQIHLYDDNNGSPNTSIANIIVPKSTIKYNSPSEEYTFDFNVSLTSGNIYYIVFQTSGGDFSNSYMLSDQTGTADGNLEYTTNAGVDWTFLNSAKVFYDITFYQLLRTKTLQNVENLIDLSDFNSLLYPEITTIFNLQRNAITDPTPVISKPSWTWKGSLDKREVLLYDITLENDVASVEFDVDPDLYSYAYIIGDNVSASTSSIMGLNFNNSITSSYSYNRIRTKASVVEDVESTISVSIGTMGSVDGFNRFVIDVDLETNLGNFKALGDSRNFPQAYFGWYSFFKQEKIYNFSLKLGGAAMFKSGSHFKVIGVKKLV